MSGPVVFKLGDKDYIAKLNQMSQQAADVQQAKADAEAARTAAEQAVTDARDAGAAEVARAAQHAADALTISQSGLPSQSGRAGHVFKSNGTVAGWAQVQISEVVGLQDKLDEIETLALVGL